VRSTSYASSKGSPPGVAGELIGGGGRRERRGAAPLLEVEFPTPVAKGRRGDSGAGAGRSVMQVPAEGAEAPTIRRSVEQAPASATTMVTGAAVTPPEPSRNSKQRFSSLR
jgi:hypothetical protein